MKWWKLLNNDKTEKISNNVDEFLKFLIHFYSLKDFPKTSRIAYHNVENYFDLLKEITEPKKSGQMILLFINHGFKSKNKVPNDKVCYQ